MALQKTITFPNGMTGNYLKFGAYTWDAMAKEASAHLMLYTSADHAAALPDQPLGLLGKLRLRGAKFDQYLSTEALQALEIHGPDPVRDQLYAAAKVEPLDPGGGLNRAELAALDLSTALDV